MIVTHSPLYKLVQAIDHAEFSGGLYTRPGNKLMLVALALSIDAKDILETGYDAGATTLALCMTGARVVAIDNNSEYPEVKANAIARMQEYGNVTFSNADALEYLRHAEDHSFDLIFIDDWHDYDHVLKEAKEARRVVRPGGFVCFHDTVVHGLWGAVETVFGDWQRIETPSIQDGDGWKGVERYRGMDFGFAVVRKPPGYGTTEGPITMDKMSSALGGVTEPPIGEPNPGDPVIPAGIDTQPPPPVDLTGSEY